MCNEIKEEFSLLLIHVVLVRTVDMGSTKAL